MSDAAESVVEAAATPTTETETSPKAAAPTRESISRVKGPGRVVGLHDALRAGPHASRLRSRLPAYAAEDPLWWARVALLVAVALVVLYITLPLWLLIPELLLDFIRAARDACQGLADTLS